MKCAFCDATPQYDPQVCLWRVHEKGVEGVWLCGECIEDNLETINDDLSDGDEPHFMHSPTCPSYCDYACNHDGFEMAKHLKPLKRGG